MPSITVALVRCSRELWSIRNVRPIPADYRLRGSVPTQTEAFVTIKFESCPSHVADARRGRRFIMEPLFYSFTPAERHHHRRQHRGNSSLWLILFAGLAVFLAGLCRLGRHWTEQCAQRGGVVALTAGEAPAHAASEAPVHSTPEVPAAHGAVAAEGHGGAAAEHHHAAGKRRRRRRGGGGRAHQPLRP